jgi:hypothetical protein
MIEKILEIVGGVLAVLASFAWCCKPKKDPRVEVADREPEPRQQVVYYVYQQGQPFPRNY